MIISSHKSCKGMAWNLALLAYNLQTLLTTNFFLKFLLHDPVKGYTINFRFLWACSLIFWLHNEHAVLEIKHQHLYSLTAPQTFQNFAFICCRTERESLHPTQTTFREASFPLLLWRDTEIPLFLRACFVLHLLQSIHITVWLASMHHLQRSCNKSQNSARASL